MTAKFSLEDNMNTTAGEIACAIVYVCGSQKEECRLRREMINQFCERNEISLDELMTMRLQDILLLDYYRANKTAYNSIIDVYRQFIEEYDMERAKITDHGVRAMISRLTKKKKNGYK